MSKIFVGILLFSLSAFSSIPSKPVMEPSLLEVLSMPEENRAAVALSLRDRDKQAAELMTMAFDSKQAMAIRWKALSLGALLKGKAATPDLEKALKSEEWFMRNAGLLAVERVTPNLAKKSAQGLLNDKALVVRSAAVHVLANHMDDSARDLMWEELSKPYNFKNKESLWVRAQIVEALSKKPEKRELPIFAKLLKDNDTRLHHYSILALEKISSKKLGTAKSTLAEKRDLWLKAKL